MELHEKIKLYRRKYLGLKQIDFGKLIGFSQQSIANFECKRKISKEFLDKFFMTFKFDLKEWDGICDPKTLIEETALKAKLDSGVGHVVSIPLIETSKLPEYQSIIPDVTVTPKMYFDINYLKNILGINPFNLILLYAQENENSFEENIREGDLLLIDRDKTAGLNKIFAVFVNNKDLKIRKIYQNLDGTFKISSENNILNEVVVIGQVIWNLSKGIMI